MVLQMFIIIVKYAAKFSDAFLKNAEYVNNVHLCLLKAIAYTCLLAFTVMHSFNCMLWCVDQLCLKKC